MRSAAEFRPPGIYQTFSTPTPVDLAAADTRITGFVGLAQKGPIHQPTRIGNWEEFVEVFGYTEEHYLSDSVQAFFRNGGTACWIVRVAHMPAADEAIGLEHASCAEHIQVDDWNKPSLRILAQSEGRWGNNIWVKCTHATGATSLLVRDLDVGAGEAQVSTTRGFEVGALVRIYDREHSDYVVLTEVGDKVVKWGSETPVNRRHRSSSPTHLEVMEFDLHVALRDRREVFKGLQMHPSSRSYAPRVVAARSRLVRIEDLGTKSPVPHNLPEPMPMTRLVGGRDGTEALTPEDFIGIDNGPAERKGLLALAAEPEVAMLAVPDAMVFYDRERGPAGELRAQKIQDEMIGLCENLKERFAILDIPESKDIEWVMRWRRRTESSFCAYYWPWLQYRATDGKVRSLPPSGSMAGVYAAKDAQGTHHAPANVALEGVEDLTLRVSEDHLGLLNAESVNSFRVQRGVRPWGARTSSSDPQWRYVNVRRLFIMLRRTLDAGFLWAVFEPNNDFTWRMISDRVVDFLTGLWKEGALAGGKAEEAFFVRCDAETNPPENVENGILTCEIAVAPVSPSEFIMVSLVQMMPGAPATAE